VALPPQLVPKTQLQFDISMALQMLLRSHIVQTVLTMHLHQQLGHSHHCAGGEQQSVALPPQWVPETQLCTD
jgi:hypothetical protein